LAEGTYSVTVTDANGCEAILSITLINNGCPTASAVATDATCGNADGTVTLSVSGGTLPYTYLWSNGDVTQNLAAVSAGIYIVTITDATNCTTTASATVTNIGGPTASAITVNTTCGNANGSIDLTVLNGTTPYSFDWSNSATSEDLTDIAAGTYTVTVTDANGCITIVSTTLTNTDGPSSVTALATDATCGNANGSVTITIIGGTAPYGFSWSNGAISQNLTNVVANTYTVVVTDANGCTATASAVVNDIPGQTVNATAFDSSCGNAVGGVTLTISGGTSPFTFIWSNGAITQDLTNIAAGIYTVTVTDDNGCTDTASATVNNADGPIASAAALDSTCGDDNGSIDVTVAGGTLPYDFIWDNGDTTEDLTNMPAGTYSVTISDANDCEAILSATVNNSNAPTASATTVDSTCGDANGSVDLTVSGGTAPYNFIWDNGDTTEDLTNVAAGTYTVTITDANSCAITASATVNNIAGPTASAIPVDSTCGDANGSIDVTVVGGTAPITFIWDSGATSEDLTNISAGTYNVTITDANSCMTTVTATITNADGPTAGSTTVDSTCGNANGSVDVTVAGGTTPYNFIWDSGETTEDLTTVAAGTYNLTITDGNGCTTTITATLTNADGPTAVASTTDSTCGDDNGSIDITVSDGTTPYDFIWNNGDTTEDLTNIAAGTYSVTITDANACAVTLSATVNNIAGPTASATTVDSTCGDDNGSVDVTVVGGTAPFTFVWSNGATTEDLTNVAAGTFDVTITDDNGCTVTVSATVNNIAGPTASATATASTCGDDNGSVDVIVVGGTTPFTYIWSNGTTTEDLTDVAAGTYNITITDANDCVATASATVNNIAGQTASASAVGSTCGDANGSVDVTVSGGTAPFTFDWDNGAVTEDLTNVLAGTYTVTVTDANGCEAAASATVVDTAGPIAATTSNDATCGNDNGSINLTVTDGTLPYTYNWSNGATTEDLSDLTAGTYTVTVTDANGCTTTAIAIIADLAVPVAFFTGPSSICLGDIATFTFTGIATPGAVYNWDFGTAGQLNGIGPHTVTWNTTGVHTITLNMTDENGCTSTFSQNITVSVINVMATVSPEGLIFPDESVTLTAVITSGLGGSYIYEWTATSGIIDCPTCATTTATPSEHNTIYTVTAYDVNGCSSTATISVTWQYEKQVVIPNAFSPNADGRNDIFRLAGVNIASFELRVFDRWGGEMFSIEDIDISKGWDGTHRGIDCELGVYVYFAIVTFTDGSTEALKGNVTLIR
jgi:gliding motility-associated-like protein